MSEKIKEWGGKGSVGVNMNKTEFSGLHLLKPDDFILKRFDKINFHIFESKKNYEYENEKLLHVQYLLLSKIATID